jgi:hypothetical protein
MGNKYGADWLQLWNCKGQHKEKPFAERRRELELR